MAGCMPWSVFTPISMWSLRRHQALNRASGYRNRRPGKRTCQSTYQKLNALRRSANSWIPYSGGTPVCLPQHSEMGFTDCVKYWTVLKHGLPIHPTQSSYGISVDCCCYRSVHPHCHYGCILSYPVWDKKKNFYYYQNKIIQRGKNSESSYWIHTFR